MVFAQTSKIDSLKQVLEKVSGTEKVDVLNQLATAYSPEDSIKRQKTLEEALLLSQEMNYKRGTAATLNNLAISYRDLRNYIKALSFFKNSLDIYKSLNDTAMIGEVYFNIGNNYYWGGISDTAIIYFERALKIQKERKDSVNFSQTLMNIGFQYWGQGNFDEAIKYFSDALEVRKKLNLTEYVANSLNSIGSAYWKSGNYLKAMEYFQQSLQIREQLNDEMGKTISWNNIGTIYQKLEYFDNAENYFQLSLDLAKKNNYEFGIAYSLYNFGLLNLDKNELDKSLTYFLQSYDIAKNILAQNLRTMILNYIGSIYEKKKSFRLAEDYYQLALDIAIAAHDKHTQSLVYQGLSRVSFAKKEFTEAERYLDKGHQLASEGKFLEVLRDNYFLYYQINLAFNNKLQALEFHKMFSDLGDSLYKAELRNSISNMIIKYEIAKTESEKQLLESENELIEKEKDYQIALRNFFIALSLLVIIMGLVLVSFYFFRVKTSKRIEEQKIELEKLNKQLNIQNAQLIELNKYKDRMFSIVAHDLRSPFHALLSFSEILRSDIKTLNEEEIQQFAENIFESSQRILTLVQNLLDWARSQLDKITINPVEFELTELINSSLEVYKKIAITKEIEIFNKTDGAIKVYADRDMINSVLRNLLSNAIKFTETGGRVEVSTSISDSEIIMCVSDTGVGITGPNLKLLFDPASHISTLGTKRETGTGLGLNLCKEFTEKNGGRIWAESKHGEGSKFFVTIPRSM